MRPRKIILWLIASLAVVLVAICIWYVWAMGWLNFGPSLVRGLPTEFALGESEFDLRLRERYPPGSSVEELRTDLRRQGFDISEASASTDWASYPCRYFVLVEWAAAEDQITQIQGHYGSACL